MDDAMPLSLILGSCRFPNTSSSLFPLADLLSSNLHDESNVCSNKGSSIPRSQRLSPQSLAEGYRAVSRRCILCRDDLVYR